MLWAERVIWLVLAVGLLFDATRHATHSARLQDRHNIEMYAVVASQREALRALALEEAVEAAHTAVDVAAQGRLDCTQALEVLTARQGLLIKSLGLPERASMQAGHPVVQ